MLWNLYFFMVLTHNRESFWTQRYKKKNLDVAEKLASAWASLRYVSFIICWCLIFVSVFESHLQRFNSLKEQLRAETNPRN